MGGRYLVPLSAENRNAAPSSRPATPCWCDRPDTAPRETPLPDDLAAALHSGRARILRRARPPSHRKEWVRWVEEAKKPETRATRIEKTAAALAEGQKTR